MGEPVRDALRDRELASMERALIVCRRAIDACLADDPGVDRRAVLVEASAAIDELVPRASTDEPVVERKTPEERVAWFARQVAPLARVFTATGSLAIDYNGDGSVRVCVPAELRQTFLEAVAAERARLAGRSETR